MKSIEKDAEKEVDNEFHAADEQYIHPPNTTKLENEIKQLDKEFGEHVQHAIGVIVNRRSEWIEDCKQSIQAFEGQSCARLCWCKP